MKEIWKKIPEYGDRYEISNLGNFKYLPYYDARGRYRKEKITKGYPTGGYLGVALLNKRVKIHQLVAIAFMDHKVNGNTIVIDHKNEIKTNNKLTNLQILTQRDNIVKSIDKTKTTSKYSNVSYSKNRKAVKKWRCYTNLKKQHIHIGWFLTEEEAHIAYKNYIKLYGVDRMD
jgi:hypothetical protein